MQVTDFDYNLPEERIAQQPAKRRDESRLLVLNRTTGGVSHRRFSDILEYLSPGDCLVINDSRVLPARLFGTKEKTGTKVEFLLIKPCTGGLWETMVKPGRRIKPGDRILFGPGFEAVVTDFGEQGTRLVRFEYEGDFHQNLETWGQMPLPPYINRPDTKEDKERYQTVYSQREGSVAAPTAGLHFTPELLADIQAKGVAIARVTLHVGIGTFRPVREDVVEHHVMHLEEYEVSPETADVINHAKAKGGRIFAVGTTSVRTLESSSKQQEDGTWKVMPGKGDTGIFIYPGYEFRMVDALVTNFHLPKSTLLMLVSAFYDRDEILKAYQIAITEEYRFFSYGDAMLIE